MYDDDETPSSGAWDVWLRGALIDTVFADRTTADEQRRSLIKHDGYDSAIEVTKGVNNG